MFALADRVRDHRRAQRPVPTVVPRPHLAVGPTMSDIGLPAQAAHRGSGEVVPGPEGVVHARARRHRSDGRGRSSSSASSAPRDAGSRPCSTSSPGSSHPTDGRVEVDGEFVVGPGPDRGVVFQSYSLFPWKNVRQNIAFGLECAAIPRARTRRADRRAARDHGAHAMAGQAAEGAVGRHAPARRHRPGARARARRVAPRRTVRRARRADPPLDAGVRA